MRDLSPFNSFMTVTFSIMLPSPSGSPLSSSPMLTDITKISADKGVSLDGFDLSYMFPPGTNFTELRPSDTSPTWELLSFHLRVTALRALHFGLQSYSRLPHMPFSAKLRTLLQASSAESYSLRSCSTDELQAIGDNVPHVIAVSLLFNGYGPYPKERKPDKVQLADGSIIEPTLDEIHEYQRRHDREVADYWQNYDTEVGKLFDQVVELVLWAQFTKGVHTLVIYEEYGVLQKHSKELQHSILAKLDTLPASQQHDISFRFAHQKRESPSRSLSVVFASDVLQGSSVKEKFPSEADSRACDIHVLEKLIGIDIWPEMFIAFDGTTAGFPIYALQKAIVFSPHRRQLLDSSGPKLLDWIQAFKWAHALRASEAIESS